MKPGVDNYDVAGSHVAEFSLERYEEIVNQVRVIVKKVALHRDRLLSL